MTGYTSQAVFAQYLANTLDSGSTNLMLVNIRKYIITIETIYTSTVIILLLSLIFRIGSKIMSQNSLVKMLDMQHIISGIIGAPGEIINSSLYITWFFIFIAFLCIHLAQSVATSQIMSLVTSKDVTATIPSVYGVTEAAKLSKVTAKFKSYFMVNGTLTNHWPPSSFGVGSNTQMETNLAIFDTGEDLTLSYIPGQIGFTVVIGGVIAIQSTSNFCGIDYYQGFDGEIASTMETTTMYSFVDMFGEAWSGAMYIPNYQPSIDYFQCITKIGSKLTYVPAGGSFTGNKDPVIIYLWVCIVMTVVGFFFIIITRIMRSSNLVLRLLGYNYLSDTHNLITLMKEIHNEDDIAPKILDKVPERKVWSTSHVGFLSHNKYQEL
jgi:hypothetical protein